MCCILLELPCYKKDRSQPVQFTAHSGLYSHQFASLHVSLTIATDMNVCVYELCNARNIKNETHVR